MNTVFRALTMLALSTWLGGLFFFPFLAHIAFSNEPNRHTAGLIVGASLILLHKIGLACGALMLLLILSAHLRRSAQSSTTRTLYPAILLLVLMMALTAFSQFSIIPRMEIQRTAAGGTISSAPIHDPHSIAFEKLHHTSVQVEGGVMLAGVLLVAALAWADGRSRSQPDRL